MQTFDDARDSFTKWNLSHFTIYIWSTFPWVSLQIFQSCLHPLNLPLKSCIFSSATIVIFLRFSIKSVFSKWSVQAWALWFLNVATIWALNHSVCLQMKTLLLLVIGLKVQYIPAYTVTRGVVCEHFVLILLEIKPTATPVLKCSRWMYLYWFQCVL